MKNYILYLWHTLTKCSVPYGLKGSDTCYAIHLRLERNSCAHAGA